MDEHPAARSSIRPRLSDAGESPARPAAASTAAAEHAAINRWAVHWGKRLVGWVVLAATSGAVGFGTGRGESNDAAPRPEPGELGHAPGELGQQQHSPEYLLDHDAAAAVQLDAVTRSTCELAAAEHVRCQVSARLAIDTFTASALACGADLADLPHPGPPPTRPTVRTKEPTP